MFILFDIDLLFGIVISRNMSIFGKWKDWNVSLLHYRVINKVTSIVR